VPDREPLKNWQEKLAFLQEKEAAVSGYAQQFELKQQIEEAKTKIAELETDPEQCFRGSPPTSPAHSVFALPGTHRLNPHFTPLPEVQAALHALQPGDVLVLHGLGGVGKTQHAVQYAHEPGDLARLAQALGGLPLALEHAAAYISETHVAVDEYLPLLARDRKTLLARHYPGMTDYRASVVTTWHVTIRCLSFLSRYILHLAACLSPDPIPRRLFDYILANASADFTHEFIELGFLRQALAAPNAIDVSLGELARYSLAALSEHNLRVHPLLQAVVRDSARLRMELLLSNLAAALWDLRQEGMESCFVAKTCSLPVEFRRCNA